MWQSHNFQRDPQQHIIDCGNHFDSYNQSACLNDFDSLNSTRFNCESIFRSVEVDEPLINAKQRAAILMW